MCGIAGIVRISRGGAVPPPDQAIPEAWLDILDAGIKHRGPDGQGRFRDRAVNAEGQTVDVAFVHRRLSIIDHGGGAQPMVTPAGGENSALLFHGRPDATPHYANYPADSNLIAVVFNGCIYNHRGIRSELLQFGRQFGSDHSDTEVLLQGWAQWGGYDNWGTELFHRIDGMYAAAWWERSSARVFVARDPFGEKPLYWATLLDQDGNVLRAFASAVPALRQLFREVNHGDCPPSSVNGAWHTLNAWIAFGWSGDLPYQHIHELQPSSIRLLTTARESRSTANSLVSVLGPQTRTELNEDTVDRILRDAVQSRLEADVPVGFFLSGGIDSALMCKYAAERTPDLTAFTVQMPDPAFDESAEARTTAAFLRISHLVLPCNANPSEDVVTLIRELGLPFGDSSLLPSMWVSRAARTVSKVAIGGDGGDELFMGYDRHRIIKLLWQLSRLPSPIFKTLEMFVRSDFDPKSLRTRAARLLSASRSAAYEELLTIFGRESLRQLGVSYTTPWERSFEFRGSWERAQTGARSIDAFHYLPLDLLRKSDTASMHTALELRAPFLSREVARAALSADIKTLMPGGRRKGLLREVARRYLPDSIVDRPKQGFAIPIGNWFRTNFGGMKSLLLDTLNSADPFPESKLGLKINREAVNRMVAEHMQGTRDHSQRLYMLTVLGVWVRS